MWRDFYSNFKRWWDTLEDQDYTFEQRYQAFSRLGFRRRMGLVLGEAADVAFAPIDWLADKIPSLALKGGWSAIRAGVEAGKKAVSLFGRGLIAGLNAGTPGFLGRTAVGGAFSLGTGLGFTIASAERIARTVLAGGSWFPYWDVEHVRAIRRYAPSTAIGKRLVTAGIMSMPMAATAALFSGVAPEPTVYYDGRTIRHVNDMGADSDYAKRILSRR